VRGGDEAGREVADLSRTLAEFVDAPATRTREVVMMPLAGAFVERTSPRDADRGQPPFI
jgi:hypothetical protein